MVDEGQLAVKDVTAFKDWLDHFSTATLISQDPDRYGFIENGEGDVPSRQPVLPDGDADPISILDEIHLHLQPGSVCIVMEAGAGPHGQAWAIFPDATTITLGLADIYAQAPDAEITEATW